MGHTVIIEDLCVKRRYKHRDKWFHPKVYIRCNYLSLPWITDLAHKSSIITEEATPQPFADHTVTIKRRRACSWGFTDLTPNSPDPVCYRVMEAATYEEAQRTCRGMFADMVTFSDDRDSKEGEFGVEWEILCEVGFNLDSVRVSFNKHNTEAVVFIRTSFDGYGVDNISYIWIFWYMPDECWDCCVQRCLASEDMLNLRRKELSVSEEKIVDLYGSNLTRYCVLLGFENSVHVFSW